MKKRPPSDELPDPDDTGFYMCDPMRCERIAENVFGVRWKIWAVILQRTDDRGFIGHTQNSLAIQFNVTERQMRTHFSIFKSANMIEKARDSEGRVRFRVCPEYFFNYKRTTRNSDVRKRQAASGFGVVDGGKSEAKKTATR